MGIVTEGLDAQYASCKTKDVKHVAVGLTSERERCIHSLVIGNTETAYNAYVAIISSTYLVVTWMRVNSCRLAER